MSIRRLFASLVVAVSVCVTDVKAGEFVTIETGPPAEPVRLIGYLARPPGAGPFSAVVLLHGCGGSDSSMTYWADRLSRFGYAALAVDSLGPRGIDQHCNYFPDQATDGFAALRYLTTRDFVRASHVAVMGGSLGGGSALAAVEKGPLEQGHPEKFRAGIAFYPRQYASGIMTGPTLVLIGGRR